MGEGPPFYVSKAGRFGAKGYFPVADLGGNVWEWVDATVENGVYNGTTLPASGYVTAADDSGVARETKPDIAVSDFHDDYFWSDSHDEYGMIRGGYFGSGSDAGTYSIQAKTQLSFSGNAIGFRCAVDL